MQYLWTTLPKCVWYLLLKLCKYSDAMHDIHMKKGVLAPQIYKGDSRTCTTFIVSPELSSVRDYVITHSVRSMCMYVVICKIDHCIHIHWCIVMGLGHNDPWIESHMWPQQTWGQRSSRGQWPLVQVFGKKGQCIHILWCIFKSNITMIAKVCDRESRRDSWFENRLVLVWAHIGGLWVFL